MKDKRISKYANTVKDQPFNPLKSSSRSSYSISKYKSNLSLEEHEKKKGNVKLKRGNKQMKDGQILKPTDLKLPNQRNNVSQRSAPSLDSISTKMSVSKSVMNKSLNKLTETKYDEFMKESNVGALITQYSPIPARK